MKPLSVHRLALLATNRKLELLPIALYQMSRSVSRHDQGVSTIFQGGVYSSQGNRHQGEPWKEIEKEFFYYVGDTNPKY
jgi:hypothetical protein